MPAERRRLVVRGVVQGVGFRPFVYRLAAEIRLGGWVANRGDAGVEMEVEGEEGSVDRFVRALQERLPPLARIDSIESQRLDPIGETSFSIAPSRETGAGAGPIAPDVALCDRCADDVLGVTRFHGYWATSCTDCGPRFTVIESLPYDRARTSMREFPLCPDCGREYGDPGDRRYHAETTACPACGPRLSFDGGEDDPVGETIAALIAGRIVAIKGIGGTHLACDATSAPAVRTLRARLGRPAQPFALMASRELVAQFAEADREEWSLLESARRPIVLLRKRPGALPEEVAPGLHTVGVMLPYSGLHHLLFRALPCPLVMTSANSPGRPMLIENDAIRERLAGVADHLLLHDRRIVARCDDSVVRRSGGGTRLLRRSRGHVPEPIPIALGRKPILALGPETDLTFALYADGRAVPSQHIGSVDNLETFAYLREAIDHLQGLLRTPLPEVVACDLHPSFLTTRLAEDLARDLKARLVRVQHHEAHAAGVLAEHGLRTGVAIVLDGFGYGSDGTAWGGEVFLVQSGQVRRVGSLCPVRLPGGDLATRHPVRMAASLLHAAGLEDGPLVRLLAESGVEENDRGIILGQVRSGLASPETTSAGRFLDAVSALLGVCLLRTYEGEPAMRLEAVASKGRPAPVAVRILRQDGRLILDTPDLFRSLYERRGVFSREDLAATAQEALARGAATIAVRVAREEGVSAVALSGGVAYNDAVSSRIRNEVETEGLSFCANERVPCGDGGVAFGQLVVAAAWPLPGEEGRT